MVTGLGAVTLPAQPASAGGWDDGGGITGAYRGGVFQDTATADGISDSLRLDTGAIGGFLVQGAIFWSSPTPPSSSGPAAELTLVPVLGDGPAVTIPSKWGLGWKGQYYYRAQLRDTGIRLDTSYRPTGLTQDAQVSAYAVIDGADVPRTWVSVMPHVTALGRDPYTESVSLLPEPPPTTGTALYGAMRPGTGPASVSFRDPTGPVSTSADLSGQTNIATAFPITRGAGATTAEYDFTPASEPAMQLYVGIVMDAPEPAMSSHAQLVHRGTYNPVAAALPGDELDLLVTLANGPGDEQVNDATIYLYEPWPTGLAVQGWSVDPTSSPGVTATANWATVRARALAPGQQLVGRNPVTVLEGPGAGETAELTAYPSTHWSTRFGTGYDQVSTSADLLPSAQPTLQVQGQTPAEWAGPNVAEVAYAVFFNNLTGPDALTSGEFTVTPPPGSTVTSIEPVGPLACEGLTCRLAAPLAAGTGTTALVTVRVPAPGTPALSASATWAPNPRHDSLTSTGDVSLHDNVAPTADVTTAPRQFTTRRTVMLRWNATEAGGSGLDRFEVQQRRAKYSGTFGSWTTAVHPVGTMSAKVPLTAGYQTCVRVRAVDRAGNASRWTQQRCSARLLDDRMLDAGAGWRRLRSDGHWKRTATVTTARGATLRLDGARNASGVAVLATTCPACGVIEVYQGSVRLARVNLRGPRTRLRHLVILPSGSNGGRLRLVVVSSGRKIEVDGVGVAVS